MEREFHWCRTLTRRRPPRVSNARVVRPSVQYEDGHASELRGLSYQACSCVVGQDWIAALRQLLEVCTGVLVGRSHRQDGVSRTQRFVER